MGSRQDERPRQLLDGRLQFAAIKNGAMDKARLDPAQIGLNSRAQSSITVTAWPARTNSLTVLAPMKPAPPVTSTRTGGIMHVLEVEAPGGWCDSDGGLRGIGLTRGGEDPTGKPAACGVNELPVAVVELKAQTAGQSVEDAVARFRSGRNPHDRVVAKRMVVWFAADQDVLMTTRLGGGEDGVLAVQRRRQRPRGGRAVRGTRPTLMVLGRRLCGSRCGSGMPGWSCSGRTCTWRRQLRLTRSLARAVGRDAEDAGTDEWARLGSTVVAAWPGDQWRSVVLRDAEAAT